ncbi:MAG: hypothetical protein NZ738_03345 [Oceanospirillaceae bacterium]|nr:hypothetical protein [Oceanospirillaceae bacterium]
MLYLAMPETEATRGLINKRRLDLLKPSCSVVNVGRQSAMDYHALTAKLTGGELAGALLDVFTPEPIADDSYLWQVPNLIITPHVSADDGDSYVPLTLNLFLRNLCALIDEQPLQNQVSLEHGY